MENPRNFLLYKLNSNKNNNVIDDMEKTDKRIISNIIDTIYYTICDYIKKTRRENNRLMGRLEINYNYTDEFHDSVDPYIYLEENREIDDTGLIMYIYDNFQRMESTKHRRIMFYMMNILYFDL
jgi:hypothetical protein|tara:strand:+ start:84 stop:455 length:372 start_codon:yes stop_codon:yes gene_type:complete